MSLTDQRGIEQFVVGGPGDFDGAECAQVLGDELRVEQAVMTGLQPRHQMHQRNLGSVAGAVKHALAEKRASETDAVKAADQVLAVIDLNRMTVAALVEFAVQVVNAGVDPGSAASRHRLRAAVDNGGEIA